MDPPFQSESFDNPSSRPWARWLRALAMFAPNGAMRIIQARTNVRVTTAAFESLDTGAPNARVTTAALEVFDTGAPNARVTTTAFETLNDGVANVRVTTAAFEVLVSVSYPGRKDAGPNPTLRPTAKWLRALAQDLPAPMVLLTSADDGFVYEIS